MNRNNRQNRRDQDEGWGWFGTAAAIAGAAAAVGGADYLVTRNTEETQKKQEPSRNDDDDETPERECSSNSFSTGLLSAALPSTDDNVRFESTNCGQPVVDETYTIRTSSSGPAFTIIIEAPGFKLDVDLVPALKFPESRWPPGNEYRNIPFGCNRNYWMVVPKPNKDGENGFDENRSWRIALQDQENKLLYNTDKMRKVICLIKYLRDSQNMNKIASYYITTIFLHELIELNNSNPDYWAMNDIQTCYIHMINKFRIALSDERISYFWNKNHNLIGNLNSNILNEYRRKINKIHAALQEPRNYKYIAQCILSADVYAWYEKYL